MEIHSKAYHKYFEGYAEKQIVSIDGKMKIERVYVGKYYKQDVSDARRAALRFIYVILYILALAVYFLCAATSLSCDTMLYMRVLHCAAFLTIASNVFPLLSYISVPREMEIRMFRESTLLLRSTTLAAAICLCLTALGIVVYYLIFSQEKNGLILLYSMGYLLSSSIILLINRMESKLHYLELPPKQERPEKSSPIKYFSDF